MQSFNVYLNPGPYLDEPWVDPHALAPPRDQPRLLSRAERVARKKKNRARKQARRK